MTVDREPRGAVPVQVLERDNVFVHGATISRTRAVVGDGVPRVLYHSGIPDQDLARYAHEIDDAKVWLNHHSAIHDARVRGTTPNRDVRMGVNSFVDAVRTGQDTYSDSVFAPLIEQRGLRRLYRVGRVSAAKTR